MPQLTDAEADPTTGDVRKVFFAQVDAMYNAWLAIDVADRPTMMTLQKSANINPDTNVIQVNYNFSFNVQVETEEVSNEPV